VQFVALPAVVAVAALPVQLPLDPLTLPVTLPVMFPLKVPDTSPDALTMFSVLVPDAAKSTQEHPPLEPNRDFHSKLSLVFFIHKKGSSLILDAPSLFLNEYLNSALHAGKASGVCGIIK
jgi:hypothetical protein